MSDFAIIPALIVALSTSIFFLAGGIWRLVARKRFRQTTEMAFGVLFFVASALIVVDASEASQVLSSQAKVLFNFGYLILFSISLYFGTRAFEPRIGTYPLMRIVRTWTVIVLGFSMVIWSYHRVQVRSFAIDFIGIEPSLPGKVLLNNLSQGMTDQGTLIPVYRLDVTKATFKDYVTSSEGNLRLYEHSAVLRAPADETANCHGWVFTTGQFLLKGSDIGHILRDHQYFEVSEPKCQDIVIYRDGAGNILHTALVQAVLPDGTIMAESKWGMLQRFLHRPEDQPYSTIFQFYRTCRPNHLIKIQSAKSDDIAISKTKDRDFSGLGF